MYGVNKGAFIRKNVGTVMDENIERAMYDEILGPLVSNGAKAKGFQSQINSQGFSSSSISSSPSKGSNNSFPLLSPRPKSQGGARGSNESVSQSIISRLGYNHHHHHHHHHYRHYRHHRYHHHHHHHHHYHHHHHHHHFYYITISLLLTFSLSLLSQ